MIKPLLGITNLRLTGPQLEKTSPNLIKGLGLVCLSLEALFKQAYTSSQNCAVYCASLFYFLFSNEVFVHLFKNQRHDAWVSLINKLPYSKIYSTSFVSCDILDNNVNTAGIYRPACLNSKQYSYAYYHIFSTSHPSSDLAYISKDAARTFLEYGLIFRHR